MAALTDKTRPPTPTELSSDGGTFWRVEGSLLNLGAVRSVAFFTWNAQSFAERWARRGGAGVLALLRPLFYAANRVFATRILHTLLRGVSEDRLDLLGEEYFHYVLKPRLKPHGVTRVKQALTAGDSIVLVSQALDHVMRPLATFLGVPRLVANRLEFRDGLATGRLLEPVIRPRGAFARLIPRNPDGRMSRKELLLDLGLSDRPDLLNPAMMPSRRQPARNPHPLVLFERQDRTDRHSVREALGGKHILLLGATGFIGKVWLATILGDLPEIGRIYLLIRRSSSSSALRRFEKMVEDSPVFDALHARYGDGLREFFFDRIEVLEGDISLPGFGLEPETRTRLQQNLDLVVNCSGLTDFNPDLRTALTINVEATIHAIDFVRQCKHAGLLHLSTCYVAGAREGRVAEELPPNYTPVGADRFDAEEEYRELQHLVREIEAQSKSPAVTDELRRVAQTETARRKHPTDAGLETHVRRYRPRWVRNQLIAAGIARAAELGWPNIYTFTKSLAESLIVKRGAELAIAVVRPSIVETSIQQPFLGWNEGVNTSAPLSYLLGTYFRQLPSNERKCLDIVPVDYVCRGMTLIGAAIVRRCHHKVYQLATSAINPCDMRRSIELTSLAHRKYYRAQESLEPRFRAKFETIPVSKARYQKLSAPRQKAIVRAVKRVESLLPFAGPPLARKERDLDRVEKLIQLYEPFILHNLHIFESQHVEQLCEALPADESVAFGYDAAAIDWWDYWINIHIPALRKWSYPLIEGRPLETRPSRSFGLLAPSKTAVAMCNTGRVRD